MEGNEKVGEWINERMDGWMAKRQTRFNEKYEIKYVFFDISNINIFIAKSFSFHSLASLEAILDWGDISRTFILCHFTIDFIECDSFDFLSLLCDKKRNRRNIYGRNTKNS